MGKIKHKTKKSAAKRFKITASGKIKMKHSQRSHQAHSKSTKQKRHSRHDAVLSHAMAKRHKYTIHR
ncbi:MAG: 50S ribosomal protein L35 [Mycoplasmataceae bacterium]|jgi:large subunit ribosomal protein L35|nr:50S ribosomal protein L35 [Mycoplasmataceae bacterium]